MPFPFLLISLVVFLIGDALISIEDVNDLFSEKRAQKTIEKANEAHKYNQIYFNESGDGTRSLFQNGVKPSELVVYDDDFSDQDGLLLNKYSEAVKIYLKGNIQGTPTCADLVATNKITLEECNTIVSKDTSFLQVEADKVTFSARGEQGTKVSSILKNGTVDGETVTIIKSSDEKLDTYKKKRKILYEQRLEQTNEYLVNKEFGKAAFASALLPRYDSTTKIFTILNRVAYLSKQYEVGGDVISSEEREQLLASLTKGVLRGIIKKIEYGSLNAELKNYIKEVSPAELNTLVEDVVYENFSFMSDTEKLSETESLSTSLNIAIN